MTIDKCCTCKHAFTTGKDRWYCKKSLADKENVLDAISRVGLRKSDTKEVQVVAECLRAVEALSPVTQEPKTGHWITKDGKEQGYDIGGIKTWYIQIMCSECRFIKTAIEGHTGQYHYCPNCGAKMVDPQERSDKE